MLVSSIDFLFLSFVLASASFGKAQLPSLSHHNLELTLFLFGVLSKTLKTA
jgi:hypothetical protein